MAPALTDVAHRVVFARDDVMLVGAIKTEPGSFQSMNELVAYVSRRGLPYLLVPTIHRNVLLNNTMLLTMRQQHEGHVADVVIPLDGKAAECVVAGQPVTRYARRAKVSRAVTQLVEELFGAGETQAEPAALTPAPAPSRAKASPTPPMSATGGGTPRPAAGAPRKSSGSRAPAPGPADRARPARRQPTTPTTET
jgi:hypothetical protein